jgi:ectoine hydroxylase-related dioxygenase (phytanoyl-CoA dioxygenase family)
MSKEIRNKIESGEGYVILPGFIPALQIADYKSILKDLYPVRASSSKKVYAERDDIKNLEDISVWWSQTVEAYKPFQAIKKLIDPVIQNNFLNMTFYASDTVTINPHSQWISPHVDTPHRFDKWNFDKRLLGIQCIVTLENVTVNNAATGVVPFSQKRDFEINKCYTGAYDRWFKDNCKQHEMPRGTLLIYNCRVLHSSMPNNTDKARSALLLNYLHKDIMQEVSELDNVWTSNGKRP